LFSGGGTSTPDVKKSSIKITQTSGNKVFVSFELDEYQDVLRDKILGEKKANIESIKITQSNGSEIASFTNKNFRSKGIYIDNIPKGKYKLYIEILYSGHDGVGRPARGNVKIAMPEFEFHG